jgi:hypothetical protein
MTASQSFPTLSAAGFRAYIDLIAYESTTWAALIHALSLFGHKTAVDAIRARLRMGESATLALPEEMTGRLVMPDTVVSRTRRAGEITHATLLRAPASLHAKSFVIVTRNQDDAARRFYRACDRHVTTPLLPQWAPWLWQWAQASGSVTALHTIGGAAWTACVDEPALEAALTAALHAQTITIPTSDSSSAE